VFSGFRPEEDAISFLAFAIMYLLNILILTWWWICKVEICSYVKLYQTI